MAASFFEKLKKGMGVEIQTEEAEEAPESAPKKKVRLSIKKPAKLKKEPEVQPAKEEIILKKRKQQKPILRRGSGLTLSKIEASKKAEEMLIEEKPKIIPEEKKIEVQEEKLPAKIMEAKEKWFEPEGQLAVDVYQTDSEIVIQSAVAGIKPEDLDISIENDVVTIRGKREKPAERAEQNYFYQECYWGPFSREIILSEEVDPSRAQALMREGILTIRVPKIERKKMKKIEVKKE